MTRIKFPKYTGMEIIFTEIYFQKPDNYKIFLTRYNLNGRTPLCHLARWKYICHLQSSFVNLKINLNNTLTISHINTPKCHVHIYIYDSLLVLYFFTNPSTHLDEGKRPMGVRDARQTQARSTNELRDLDRDIGWFAEHHVDVDGQLKSAMVLEVHQQGHFL